jgi:Domain of unknown function (DUF4258)
MAPAKAILDIRGFASVNRIRITRHAEQRMDERGVEIPDVRHALITAAACTAEAGDRWRVRSADREGVSLTLIVVLEDGVIVVTLFD